MMGAVTYPNSKVVSYVSDNLVPWKVSFDTEGRLLRRYNVFWTPTIILADAKGNERYRITGFLPPETFVACIALGRAYAAFWRHHYSRAAELFDAVADEYPRLAVAPEAIYFRGVSRRKATMDDVHLDESTEQLLVLYPESEWAQRAKPWAD